MCYLPYTGIGSRETPEHVLKKMVACSTRLKELGFTLRSGGARGSDSAMESGGGGQAEIYLPYDGYEGKWGNNRQYITASSLPSYQQAMQIASEVHPRWESCGSYARRMHARNGYQILGKSLAHQSLFVVCWTKGGGEAGGTGQALRLARQYGVPVFNMYFDDSLERLGQWLRENGYV